MPHVNIKALIAAIALTSLQVGAAVAAPPAGGMSFQSVETRARQLGVNPTEIELKNRHAKVEGRDRQGRKVELTLNRQTGAVIKREIDRD